MLAAPSVSSVTARVSRWRVRGVREVLRSALSAACVACGTLGGAIAGAIAGAATRRGVVGGAVRGAYAGAFTLLETLDLGVWFDAGESAAGDSVVVGESADGSAVGSATAGGRRRSGESYAVLADERDGAAVVVAMPFTHAMNFAQVLRMVASDECSRGASASGVADLPVRAFRDEDATTQGTATTCAVCLCGFVEGETLKTLPNCSHEFHESCVDRWLLRRDCCPMCRRRASVDRDRSDESDRDE